jgi:hypothetical protein
MGMLLLFVLAHSALLFLNFSLPMMLLYKEKPAKQADRSKSFLSGYIEIGQAGWR